jgi:phosphoglycolate phosphatase-like HAD superfamily hydrolase
MAATNVIYALDFDGCICDSVAESAVSAVRALRKVWPGPALATLTADAVEHTPAWLLTAIRAVRPVVETGYENVLLARALVERGEGADADAFVDKALGGAWPEMRDELVQQWKADKEQLVEVFGSVRDEWIKEDFDGWMAASPFYPGVVDALNFSVADVYIITTKQTRFVKALLTHYGVRGIPEERIYGYGSGTKISVLKKIIALPQSRGKTIAFLEDRYETVEAVSISMLGQPLELFLASWGYSTEKTRETASQHPFINVIDLPTFVNKMQ